MSPLVLFAKQLFVPASHPGTKTHFRSSHSNLKEHHIPHCHQHNTFPTPTSSQGKQVSGLTTRTPAWGSVLLPAGHSPTLLPPHSKQTQLSEPLRPSATTQAPLAPQGHLPYHMKNPLLPSPDSS